VCGRPIEGGGPGRAASSCSQACRQRAYRERRQPAPGAPAGELFADIGDRLRRLRLDPAPAFHADVEALSPRFAQLWRLARQARQDTPEAPGQDVPDHGPARGRPRRAGNRHPGRRLPGTVTQQNVTPAAVTKPGDDALSALFEEHRAEHCYRLLGSDHGDRPGRRY
jgi:RNA polymerase sigma-70 factor (ECF subfamily)